MTQGAIAGVTDYRNQSIEELTKDLEYWKKYSDNVSKTYADSIAKYSQKSNPIWNKTPYNFKIWCNKIIKTTVSFSNDIETVLNCIKANQITEKCVKLIRNIGDTASEYSNLFRDAFNGNDDWQEYDNKEYFEIENLYCEGADYFATLWDASNLASRLEDYMENKKEVNINNSINIGDGNNLSNAHIESNNKNSNNANPEPKKESFFKKWWWCFVVPLAVAVIAGVVVFVITKNL